MAWNENKDLPAYVVLTSWGTGRPNDQPLYDRLWGAGFLPTQHQGVKFRNSGDPVLYLSDPKGVSRSMRRGMLDELAVLNRKNMAVAEIRKLMPESPSMKWRFACNRAFLILPTRAMSQNIFLKVMVRMYKNLYLCSQLFTSKTLGRKRCPLYSTISYGLGSPWWTAQSNSWAM